MSNDLLKARRYILDKHYDEGLALYTELVTNDPLNNELYLEHLAVKGELIALEKGRYVDTVLQHVLEANMLSSKREIRILLQDPRYADNRRLERYGEKIYSQCDEDGIIKEIFRRIGTGNRRFFEFGVENGIECNTHALLHQGWSGAWAEKREDYIAAICERFAQQIIKGQLALAHDYVTAETINDIVEELGLPFDLDLMSIDIDFNDYWVFKALTAIRPRVLVIEYNAKFPPPIRHVVTYDRELGWSGSDYFGCSLQSLYELAYEKDYQLVGCNIIGMNAFFVRSDLCQDKFSIPATAEHLYQPPRYELHRAGAYAGIGHPADAKFGDWLDI